MALRPVRRSGPDDVYVSSSQIRRLGLRIGDRVSGSVRAPREGEKYWGMIRVDRVNGVDSETARRRPKFEDLTPVHPDELINLETDPKSSKMGLTTSFPAQIVSRPHASTASWRRAGRLFGSGYFLM